MHQQQYAKIHSIHVIKLTQAVTFSWTTAVWAQSAVIIPTREQRNLLEAYTVLAIGTEAYSTCKGCRSFNCAVNAGTYR